MLRALAEYLSVSFTTRTRKLSTRPRSKLMLLIMLAGSLDVSTLVCYPALTKHGVSKNCSTRGLSRIDTSSSASGRFSRIGKKIKGLPSKVYVVSTQTFSPHKPFLRTNLFSGYGCLYFERKYIIICDNYDKWFQLAVFYLRVVRRKHL